MASIQHLTPTSVDGK